MSQLITAPQGLLFCSVIYQSEIAPDIFLSPWIDRYGVGEIFYPQFNPAFTYYSKEMGSDLNRLIYFSLVQHPREQLIQAKLWATEFEIQYQQQGKRSINIDPGLMTLENMILSTGKPFTHRIYLGQGVYADLNYIYQKGSYRSLPWTYPDYAHDEKIAKFNSIRSHLL